MENQSDSEIYKNWKKQHTSLLALIHKVQEANPESDPEEAWQDVLVAQRAVRTESKQPD